MKCWGLGYVLRPPGAEPEEPGRSKGEVHIFNIHVYIIDSKRFHVDWLKTLGQVHYTKFCVRRMDGCRTDGWTDGHHLELSSFNYTKSRFDTHRYHFRWKQKMHARTGQNLYGPLTIVRRAIKITSIEIKNIPPFLKWRLDVLRRLHFNLFSNKFIGYIFVEFYYSWDH